MKLEALLNKNKGDSLNDEELQFVNEIKDYVYKLINNEHVDEFNYDKTYAYAKLAKFGIIEDKMKTIDFIFETMLYNGLYDYDTDKLFETYPILLEYVDNVLDQLDLNQLESLSCYYYDNEDYSNYFKICKCGANFELTGMLGGFELVNTLIKIDYFKYQLAYCYIYGTGTKPNYVEAFKLFLNYRRDHLVYKNGADNFTEEDLNYLYNKLKDDYDAGKKYPGLFYSLAVMNREGIGTNYNPHDYKKYSELGLKEYKGKSQLSEDEKLDSSLLWEYITNHTINKDNDGGLITNLCTLDNIEVDKVIELGKYDHRSVLWKVLDIREGKALLLSTSILDNIYPVNIPGDIFENSLKHFEYNIGFENEIDFELKYLKKSEIDNYLSENDRACFSRSQAQINGYDGIGVRIDETDCSPWFVNDIDEDGFAVCIDTNGEYYRDYKDSVEVGFRPAMLLDLKGE